MARLKLVGNNLTISFTGRESRLIGRPNLKVDKSRIKAASLESNFEASNLGIRVSRRPLFGGLLGEYRKDKNKILIIGKSGESYLKLALQHPTIDQIWYFGSDAESLLVFLNK